MGWERLLVYMYTTTDYNSQHHCIHCIVNNKTTLVYDMHQLIIKSATEDSN